jgi:hypothetical protein
MKEIYEIADVIFYFGNFQESRPSLKFFFILSGKESSLAKASPYFLRRAV